MSKTRAGAKRRLNQIKGLTMQSMSNDVVMKSLDISD